MEAKPIVTCHGDQTIFSSLHPTLVQTLPKEPTEWRRSYGRPPKTVYIEASFVPYDEDILPKETDKTLVSRPYFHIFWADGDLENYKQTVKEEMTEWHSALKNNNIPDWLIVVVNNDETKSKTKLLPRSSVIDKVKNDFCGKQPDRCIAITVPIKQDQKSLEAWTGLLQRLRNLLLQAYNRHLSKYEENMRLLREKRNEQGWGFIQFFLIQEELAFMFEMLGLYDDAMIQYDELDALFSQFVITKVSGTVIPWLTTLIQDCKSWAGVNLQKAINRDKRDQIKDNEASLLQFRNYLFSRQCALLFLLGKPSEVSRRAMEHLFNTVVEVKKLKINVIPGALDCWSFVSALEVLQSCEKYEDLYNPELFYLYRATLWDHARKKLYSLGELCGLMPEDDIQPSSEQLTMVLDLTSGMGIADDTESEIHQPRPRDKLREALSSKDSFQKIYLELLEQAMGTFKHIGRFRCARLITKDLALFYMRMGQPEKAENYLSEAVKSYHQEGWIQLSEGTRLDLAKCQDKLKHRQKFLQTALYIASSTTLPESDRKQYYDRICLEAQEKNESSPLKASPLISVEDINFQNSEVFINHMVCVKLKINCKAPCDVKCDKICLSFIETKSSPEINTKPIVSRQSSDTSLTEHVPNCKPMTKLNANFIPLQENMEGNVDDPVLCGVYCFQAKEILRRTDSAGSNKGVKVKSQLIKKEDYQICLTVENFMLKPGENEIELSKRVEKVGQFKTNQFWVELGHLELIKTFEEYQTFRASYHQTHCEIRPITRDKLLMGLENQVELVIENSDSNLEEGCKLELVTSPDLELQGPDGTRVLFIDKDTEEEGNLKFNLTMFHDIIDEESIEMGVKIVCDRLPQPLHTTVKFVSPLIASHKVHTSNKRKYLQIILEGHSDSSLNLSNPTATTDNKDVEFICLSKPDQIWNVYGSQKVSYLWELKCNTDSVMSLPVDFQVNYTCSVEQKTRKFDYNCLIDNFRTLYHVRVSVLPSDQNKHSQANVLSCLKIEISSLSSSYKDDKVLYEIEQDKYWTLSEKYTGLINITNGHGNIQLNIIPTVIGNIPLPKVKLFQYIESDATENKQENGDQAVTPLQPSTQEIKIDNANQKPFQHGQVYYASIAKQAHVYPNVQKDVVIDNSLNDTKI